MAYVLIIVSFVAMGGPKDTTPTIDHIPFATKQGCDAGKDWVARQMNGKVHFSVECIVD